MSWWMITLVSGTTKEVNILEIGATNADVFVGLGSAAGAANGVGFQLTGGSLALALVNPTDGADSSSYYALHAAGGSLSVANLDDFAVCIHAATFCQLARSLIHL